MKNKSQKSIIAGIIGTAIMTIVMMLAPMIGMPKMSPPHMLSGMLGVPIAAGWIMHFMIGIIFAFTYTYMFTSMKIKNIWMKGAVFGIIVFVFAQIVMAGMGMLMPMPKMEDTMMLSLIESFIGHIVFGMTVAKTVGEKHTV